MIKFYLAISLGRHIVYISQHSKRDEPGFHVLAEVGQDEGLRVIVKFESDHRVCGGTRLLDVRENAPKLWYRHNSRNQNMSVGGKLI